MCKVNNSEILVNEKIIIDFKTIFEIQAVISLKKTEI